MYIGALECKCWFSFFYLFIFLSWDFCTKPLKWAWSGEKGAKERRLLSDNVAADGCNNKQDVKGMTCAVSEHPLVLPQQRWLQRPILMGRCRSVLYKILKVLSPIVWLIYLKIKITWTFAVVAVFLWNWDEEKTIALLFVWLGNTSSRQFSV